MPTDYTIIVRIEYEDARCGQEAAFDYVCRALEDYTDKHADSMNGVMLHIATPDGHHTAEI